MNRNTESLFLAKVIRQCTYKNGSNLISNIVARNDMVKSQRSTWMGGWLTDVRSDFNVIQSKVANKTCKIKLALVTYDP